MMAPKQSRANLDAAEADITTSEVSLRNVITAQYLTSLQAQARAVLQDTLVASAQAQLELARAREAVGAASSLDVRRAEVQLGQQQVTRIRERNTAQIELLRLFQQMGVPQPENVRLTTDLPVTEPTVQLQSLLTQARSGNPAIVALRARQRSADVSVSRAKSAYLPSLSLQTGISGFTQQNQDIDGVIADEATSTAQQQAACFTQDSIRTGAGMPSINTRCQGLVFTPADASALREFNEQWPFDMTRNPISLQLQFSVPIWNGYSREQQIQEATASRRDAEFNVRQQDLRLTADVTAAHLVLTAAYEAVRIQEQNSATARDALTLAQERFRVGASSFIDVQTARADYERAETERINAIYEFHKAFAALEAAVGRPLR
jgi:outer membrane protein